MKWLFSSERFILPRVHSSSSFLSVPGWSPIDPATVFAPHSPPLLFGLEPKWDLVDFGQSTELTQETALNAILRPLQGEKNEDIRNERTQQWRKPPQEGEEAIRKGGEGGFKVVGGVLGGAHCCVLGPWWETMVPHGGYYGGGHQWP